MSADLLRRAAKTLREHARLATAGPWSASVVDSPRSHMNSAVYSMAHPTGMPESEVVGAVRKDRCAGIRNPNDARYLELMHPPVAFALATVLDVMVGGIEALGPVDTEACECVEIDGYHQMVTLAREILRQDGPS